MNALHLRRAGAGRHALRDRVPMRPDFEAVLPPVIDWLLAQEGVDPAKLVLVGRSFAGYLAPRAAAHEPRLAALVCDPGQYDFVSRIVPRMIDEVTWAKVLAADPRDRRDAAADARPAGQARVARIADGDAGSEDRRRLPAAAAALHARGPRRADQMPDAGGRLRGRFRLAGRQAVRGADLPEEAPPASTPTPGRAVTAAASGQQVWAERCSTGSRRAIGGRCRRTRRIFPVDRGGRLLAWSPGAVRWSGGACRRNKTMADPRSRQGISGVLGPVPSRRAGARLAAVGAGQLAGDRLRHPRRAGAGGDHRARTRHPADRDGVRRLLSRLPRAGRARGAEADRRATSSTSPRARAPAVLVIDDLVDTGKTARLVRDMVPKCHYATMYAKPAGPAAGRHLHHRGQPGHLDLFPLGHGLLVPAADRAGYGGVGARRAFRGGRKNRVGTALPRLCHPTLVTCVILATLVIPGRARRAREGDPVDDAAGRWMRTHQPLHNSTLPTPSYPPPCRGREWRRQRTTIAERRGPSPSFRHQSRCHARPVGIRRFSIIPSPARGRMGGGHAPSISPARASRFRAAFPPDHDRLLRFGPLIDKKGGGGRFANAGRVVRKRALVSARRGVLVPSYPLRTRGKAAPPCGT